MLETCSPYQHGDGSISYIGPDMCATCRKDERQRWYCVMTYKGRSLVSRKEDSAELAFRRVAHELGFKG